MNRLFVFIVCIISIFSTTDALHTPKNEKRAKYLREKKEKQQKKTVDQTARYTPQVAALQIEPEEPELLFARAYEVSWQNLDLTNTALEEMEKHKPESIWFDYDSLIFNEYGVCSAMTLDFLGRSLKTLQQSPKTNLEKAIQSFSPYYQGTPSRLISIQAAFNTIGVDLSLSSDTSWEKMQTLASFYGMQILPSSETFYCSWNSWVTLIKNQEKMKGAIENLSEGIYLIRCISPNEESRKLEYYGHSMGMIVTGKDQGIFFDPAIGALKKTAGFGDYVSEEVFDWGIEEIRLYRILDDSSVQNLNEKPLLPPEGNFIPVDDWFL